MTKAVYQVRGARERGEWGLFPVDDQGVDLMKNVKGGRDVMVNVHQARNPAHHRLYWAIVKFIKMHSPSMSDLPEARIHLSLKVASGLVDPTIDLDTGKVVQVVRSIAWESMDQSEFSSFFEDAVQVITKRWMPPGTTAERVRAEILEMVNPYKGGEVR